MLTDMVLRITVTIDNFLNKFKFAWQRVFRGYDDRAYWNLDLYIAKIALPVLQHYLALTYKDEMGLFGDFYKLGYEKGKEKQIEALKKMIQAFKYIKDDEVINHEKEVNEGLKLFVKHYHSLWD